MKIITLQLWLIIAVVFSIPNVIAQSDPTQIYKHKITPPSPEASSMARYGDYPVTLSNGLVNISVPIYTIKSGELSVPITLNYHAAGVKVNDIASSVGLGWALSAGETISRAIMGKPDESGLGILYNPFPDPDDPGEHFECFLAYLTMGQDGKSDIFNYSLGGSNGKFLFKNVKATGTPVEITTIPYSPIRITVTQNLDTFKITDLDGTIYTFGEAERTVVMSDGSLESDAPTAWYLTSVQSSDKSDTIRFTYTDPVQTISSQTSNSFSVRDDITYLAGRVSQSISQSTNYYYAVNVEEILFKNGKVHFDYSTDRQDINGGRRLDKIRLYQKEADGSYSEIKRFSLNQSYFSATGSQTSHAPLTSSINNDKRLRLDSVLEQGVDNSLPITALPPHKFEYEGGAFPLYSSTAQDFMGFYNGAHSNANLLFYGVGTLDGTPMVSKIFGANREIDTLYLKAGILKKITFPTGGNTIFETEPNQHNYTETVNEPIFTSYEMQVTSYDVINYEKYFTMTSEMTGNQNSITAQFKITGVNNREGEPQLNTVVRLKDETTGTYAEFTFPDWGSAYYPIVSADPFPQPKNVTLYLGHTYKLYYDDPQHIPETWNFFYGRVSWKIQTGTSTYNQERTVYTGGLRIKSLTSNDGVGNTLRKEYKYPFSYYNTSLFSGDISDMADKYKSRISRYASVGGTLPSSYWFDVYGENFTFQAGSSTNSVGSYGTVEEYSVDDQGKPSGKTVYNYNVAIDNIPSLAPDFRSDEEWRRSQLTNQRIYKTDSNDEFVLIKEIMNEYDYDVLDFVESYSATLLEEGHSELVAIIPFRECSVVDVADYFQYLAFRQAIFKSNLISTTTIEFDTNGLNPDTTRTEYLYDSTQHYQLTRTTTETSDAKILTSDLKYPLDYTVGNCDLEACYSGYYDDLENAISQRTSCEQLHYGAYASYSGQAEAVAYPLQQDKVQYIQDHCYPGGTLYMPCLGTAENRYQDQLEDSEYHELIAMADAEWINYTNCQPAFQLQVSQIMAQLITCGTNYTNCVDAFITGQTSTKEKSLLIMQRDNVINQVIEQTSGFNLNGTEYITSGNRTDFKPVNNGATAINDLWSITSQNPILKNVYSQNPEGYYRKVASVIEYDHSNNIIEESKEHDVINAYVWDYNNEFPVAMISNANSDESAYTSFEADGTGNFVIGSVARQPDGRTGNQCYRLTHGSISKSNLTTGKTYVLNFWAKSGTVSVNGLVLTPASAENVNGWQYYETNITGSPSITTASLSGSALVDELRFYPFGARMTTYTYDPLIGVTSKTDPNSLTVYYEYDDFGRLKTVKDQDKNILKTYTYHYKE